MALSINSFFKPRPRRFTKQREIVCGDEVLLAGGVLMALLAILGIAGINWRALHFVTGDAMIFATFLTPAFLVVGLKDLVKLGWNWKRVFAIAFLGVAIGLIVLAFREVLSTTPVLRHY